MWRWLLGIVLLLQICSIGVRVSVADELANAIRDWEERNFCPTKGEAPIHKYGIYCKDLCDRAMTCRGNKSTDPCGNGSSPACSRFADEAMACLKDMNERNRTIAKYNEIVRKCRRRSPRSDAPAPSRKKSPLQEAVERQKEKSKDADRANAESRERVDKFTTESEREMSDLKEQKQAACDSRVAQCRASARNAACQLYCDHLEIEKCADGSSTLAESSANCMEASREYWSALAISSGMAFGYAQNAPSREEAEQSALRYCRNNGSGCRLAGRPYTEGCIALASCSNGENGGQHGIWWQGGSTESDAANAALAACANHRAPRCYIRKVICQTQR